MRPFGGEIQKQSHKDLKLSLDGSLGLVNFRSSHTQREEKKHYSIKFFMFANVLIQVINKSLENLIAENLK